jgi:1,4-dihydroxy-2-naphthoate octaprenyltransferase
MGPLHWGWLALSVAGVLCIDLGKHASGEIFDFNSGADLAVKPEDLTPFSGGKRVLVEKLLTKRETSVIAASAYFLGSCPRPRSTDPFFGFGRCIPSVVL